LARIPKEEGKPMHTRNTNDEVKRGSNKQRSPLWKTPSLWSTIDKEHRPNLTKMPKTYQFDGSAAMFVHGLEPIKGTLWLPFTIQLNILPTSPRCGLRFLEAIPLVPKAHPSENISSDTRL
jgi:hypothetical protein